MLYIYRASAGSGKTFLLAGFFIKLLFRKELTPSLEGRNMLFSEILAVTFTNKATAEMKERIIEDLNTLWKNPIKSNYYKDLKEPDCEGKILSDEDIKNRAHEILTEMLTDYSNLHISTIHSFFQQVIRSFAHELNVQGNYEIELDADMVLDNAVSQFLLMLDPEQDPDTYDWLLRFSNSRLLDGSNWNVHHELLKLAKVLTTEDYRKYSAQINRFTSDKQKMGHYLEMLDQQIGRWKSTLKRIGTDCANLINSCNLKPEDFSGGARSAANNFTKWAKGDHAMTATIHKWAEDPNAWFSKANIHLLNQMGGKAEVLQSLLREAIEHMEGTPFIEYNSAVAIRKNFYQLGLLCRLEQEANDYCAQQGIKLLSNTTQMLNALVADQSAPFIYEKTGTRILSYMIDEFQDTSGMQWDNFAPLLRDSLGTDNRDLIVGDVKQSIYRWRGSDWALLHSHINRFMPEMQDKDENGNLLVDNWRSDQKIIDFNNDFFTFASNRLSNLESDDASFAIIKDIYSDVHQQVSIDRKNKYKEEHNKEFPDGYIAFETLDGKTVEEYHSAVQTRLPELVIALQQKGYKPSDILILCRKRDQCHLCAKALMDYQNSHPNLPYGMNIITQEALLLYKQPVIRALVSALYLLLEPKSEYRRAVAGICWHALSSTSVSEAVNAYVKQKECPDFDSLLNMPLYETVEQLVAMLPASTRKESNFIQAFCDVVLSYCSKEGPKLSGFLHWWHDHGQGCSVTTPSQQDAIRIMTIHQSKGLAGNVVIIPFAQDSLDIKTNGFSRDLLWCEPQQAPFACEDLVIPIEISSSLKDTIFASDYNAERIRAIIDNLNTAYVAFTRAKHAMIILSPTPGDKDSVELQKLLQTFFNEWGSGLDSFELDVERLEIENQSLPAKPTEGENDTADYKTQNAPMPLIKRTDYVAPDDAATNKGTTLHDAFSAVIDRTKIEEPITNLFRSGKKELKGYTLQEVIEQVKKAIEETHHPEWFDPSNRVLNEWDIITRTTHTQRPDRIVITPDGRVIVIDYKTGNEEPAKYRVQVAHYMYLLSQMGFKQIEGYLWYINLGKEIAINMEEELRKLKERKEKQLQQKNSVIQPIEQNAGL